MTAELRGGELRALEAGARARTPSRTRDLGILAATKLAVSLFTLAVGFRGVSDDDFARVVIAQGFADSPKLDPSGTSWLPFPFWWMGAIMRATASTLSVGYGVAVVSGILAVWLVYESALLLTRGDPRRALAAGFIAACLPWSARLGVSPVPELLSAALSLYALGTLESRRPIMLGYGALALLCATLSRYDPWLIAFPFAAFAVVRARRGSAVSRLGALASAAIALLGPLGWMLWNARAHGSAVHFLDRVAAYKDAIDHGNVLTRLTSYAFSLLRAEPEFLAAAIAVGVLSRRELRSALSRYRAPIAVSLFLLVTLTAASVRGGAPTHHPERALYVLFLLLAVIVSDLGLTLVETLTRERLRHLAIRGALLIGALSFPIRRWVLQGESYADRTDEVDIGERAAAHVASGERVMVEVSDYGYFAVLAGAARPRDFIPSGAVDPRRVGAVAPVPILRAKARAEHCRYLVVSTARGLEGPTIFQNQRYALLAVNP